MSRDIGFCPLAAMKPAHWWPPFLPTGGHETAHLGWGREEPGVSRTGDFGFSYAARWFSNHSRSTSLGVIYPKAE